MRLLSLHMPAAERGLTLIEMMVAVSIAAILALTGLPFFGDYVINSRLRESGNQLMTDALFAQSEAIKRNGLVAVEFTDTTIKVVDHSSGGNVLLRERPLPDRVSLGTPAPLNFGSTGRPTPFGADYAVDFSMSGITCSEDKRCPGLRVDAGGSVRLCGNRLSCS